MKYVIYKIVTYRDVLEELDKPGINTTHSTMEDAINEIMVNRKDLKFFKLTVLPVIEFDWSGEVINF
jgi:hypothetical protein